MKSIDSTESILFHAEETSSVIHDNVTNEVSNYLKKRGLGMCKVIVGIDYTMSNLSNGEKTFFKKSLHDISDAKMLNPYEISMATVVKTMIPFDIDGEYTMYGFGDESTTNVGVFPFDCQEIVRTIEGCKALYRKITKKVRFAGPSNLAPIVYEAIRLSKQRTSILHVLIILTDGSIDNMSQTKRSIIAASNYSLCILCVGIGDSAWSEDLKFKNDPVISGFGHYSYINIHDFLEAKSNIENIKYLFKSMSCVLKRYKKLQSEGKLPNITENWQKLLEDVGDDE